MAASNHNSSNHEPKPVSKTAILEWLEQLRQWGKTSPLAPLLDFDGIDAIDVCLSPLYLNVLNALRKPLSQPLPAMQSVISRVRNEGFLIKTSFWEKVAARQSAAPQPVDVLLWSRDITHTAIMQPVCKSLHELHVPAAVFMCQANIYLTRHDQQTVFALRAWPQIVRDARKEGVRRAQEMARHARWDIPEFPGVSQEVLEHAVRKCLLFAIPQVCEAHANATAAMDTFRPRAFVAGYDITLEGRVGCRVAKARGIPSAVFMHGSITGDPLQSLHAADKLLVYGSVHREELKEHGIDDQRIIVCGAPTLDSHPGQSGVIDPILRERFGLKENEPWILVATSGPGHRISHKHHLQVIDNLQKLCAAMPNTPIVVKLHRKDRLEYYQEGLKNCPDGRIFVVSHDSHGFPQSIFSWLQGCGMVLTGASAVSLEAMVMKVPVITMDFADEIHDVDFIDQGATEHVTSSESLIQTVQGILSRRGHRPEVQAHVQAFLEGAYYSLDGQSAMRGATALRDMMTRHESVLA